MIKLSDDQLRDYTGPDAGDAASTVVADADSGPPSSHQPERPETGDATLLSGPMVVPFGRDWRTIDPATIRGEGIPAEETLYYQEKIEELMQHGAGRYVLIVGREIINFFDDLESAAEYALAQYPRRRLLIKKVSFFEPIHTIERVVLEPLRDRPTREA